MKILFTVKFGMCRVGFWGFVRGLFVWGVFVFCFFGVVGVCFMCVGGLGLGLGRGGDGGGGGGGVCVYVHTLQPYF